MKVLFISYDGMTDPLGQSQVIPYLAGLKAKGHEIWLMSCEKPERFAKHKNEINDLLQNYGIEWLPLKYHLKPPVLSTILDIYQIKKRTENLYRRKQIDAIHCRGYISAIVGLQMKQKYGLKFIFDMRGFFADERKEGGLWNTASFIYKKVYSYFKEKELQFFSNADYSISLTEAGKKIIHNWKLIPNNPVPIKVIPCCADLGHFKPENADPQLKEKLKERFSIADDDFVLAYLGSVGTWYMLDEMLDFFKELHKELPKSKFLFITGDEQDMILKSANKKGIDQSCLIIEKSERKDLPSYLSLCTASIFFIKPVFSKQASSPTKMGELMSMGIPLVCNKGVGDVDSIMESTKAGYLVHDFTKGEYVAALDYLKNLDTFYDAESARQGAKNVYSLEKGVELYNEVYTELQIKPSGT